ncbi:MAG: acetyl-CoA carboxylase carboxyltransferase subunit alpha, partial [Candidatus Subteraquimicrobiales bacterium]|nr:acetyl-CoA carboxylase carboxyltransferase subunit alpha [Candidatus Subteraquimicrobiales bacterium]
MDFEKSVVELEIKIEELKKLRAAEDPSIAHEIELLEEQLEKLRKKIYSNLTPWQQVQIARHPNRPRTLDYVGAIFSDFVELHGDRLFKDDPAVVGGLAYFDGERVAVIGHQKGRDTKENIHRNFGMAHPEGYRKALRLMKLAEKFKVPVVCFIDTPGAYPGIGAEERGQATAIATNLIEMSEIKIPIIAVNIGEGGSGGALALGIADRVLMLENAYYSVISPEGCASILWRDNAKASEAAEALCLTADKLLSFGIIDKIISEPLGGAHRNPEFVIEELRKALRNTFVSLLAYPIENLLENRYKKYRKIGSF